MCRSTAIIRARWRASQRHMVPQSSCGGRVRTVSRRVYRRVAAARAVAQVAAMGVTTSAGDDTFGRQLPCDASPASAGDALEDCSKGTTHVRTRPSRRCSKPTTCAASRWSELTTDVAYRIGRALVTYLGGRPRLRRARHARLVAGTGGRADRWRAGPGRRRDRHRADLDRRPLFRGRPARLPSRRDGDRVAQPRRIQRLQDVSCRRAGAFNGSGHRRDS